MAVVGPVLFLRGSMSPLLLSTLDRIWVELDGYTGGTPLDIDYDLEVIFGKFWLLTTVLHCK